MQTLFNRFDSYTEYSVSGTGTHIYGKCEFDKIPTYIGDDGKIKLNRAYYQKNPNNKIELYMGGITNRFAVYTGNVIFDKPLKECTTAVLTTLEKNMLRKSVLTSVQKQMMTESCLTLSVILEKLKTKKNLLNCLMRVTHQITKALLKQTLHSVPLWRFVQEITQNYLISCFVNQL